MPESFDHAFAAETLGKLDRNNWNRFVRTLNTRMVRLEEVLPTLEIAEDSLVASGLARLEELLEPALLRAEAFSSGAFLVATTSTALLPVVNQIQTVILDEGVQLQAFIPTAFLVLTRDADPNMWALVRTFDYKKTSGELMFRTLMVEGTFFAYDDWRVVASASEPLAVHTWAQEVEAGVLAAGVSANNATDAAETATDTLVDFRNRYLGAFASNPTETPSNDPLEPGMMYFNTSLDELRIRNSINVWAQYSSASVTAAAFADLTDAPDSYAGHGNEFVRVKEDVSGLEFVEGISRDEFDTHATSQLNPHGVTASQVGLSALTNFPQLTRSNGDWAGFTSKVTPADLDVLLIEDSESAGMKKVLTFANIKQNLNYEPASATILKTGVAGQFTGLTEKATPVDADLLVMEDSAAATIKKKLTWSGLKATLKTYNDSLYQTVGALLSALTALATTGLIIRTGAGTVVTRTITAGVNLQITDGDGINGNPTIKSSATSPVAYTGNSTLQLSDEGKVVEMNVASGNTLTVPPNSSVAFPTGTWINFAQLGAGQTTIVAGAGVTLRYRYGLKCSGQYSMGSLYKRGTNEWVVGGDLVA